MSKRVLILAGEASGDLHAAHLVSDLMKLAPETTFFGMGGNHMRQAGVNILVDNKQLATVGLGFFKLLKPLISALRLIKKIIRQSRPDLVILIDYPGFNLKIAKYAHKLGVKVLYYISPQVWAWRQGRVKLIDKVVDTMAVVFPFEVDFYQRHGIKATFVGHPSVPHTKATLTKEASYSQWNLDAQHPIVGLMPGSRHGEIKTLLPIMIGTAKLLKQQNPQLQFLLPIASTLTPADIKPHIPADLKITFIENNTYNALQICDAVITASGTATLEIALLGIPMVIIYKVATLTYKIAMRVMKVKYLGLCNIIAEKEVAKEFWQDQATPENIFQQTQKLLVNTHYRHQIQQELLRIRNHLVAENAEKNIAELALELLNKC